jgi:hypothetical protein
MAKRPASVRRCAGAALPALDFSCPLIPELDSAGSYEEQEAAKCACSHPAKRQQMTPKRKGRHAKMRVSTSFNGERSALYTPKRMLRAPCDRIGDKPLSP